MLEQGALAFHVVRRGLNGLEARKLERELSKVYVDRVRSRDKILLYREINLDWFEDVVGTITVLDKNLSVAEQLPKRLSFVDYVRKIPNLPIRTLGQLLVVGELIIPFHALKGRKIIG